ncbi:unnamed protein product [Musa textilis]
MCSEIIGSEADQPGAHGLRVGIVAPAAVAAAASRKRPRPPSFLGGDGLCYLQQQMLDFDRLVLQHAESVRAALAVRRHRFARRVVAALEAGVLERLKAREEEIARVGERNWALEERIRRLRVENQVWRDLAQSSEATANVLRANLEHALAAAQVRAEEEEEEATADNAEFCRAGTNEEGEAAVGRGRGTACRSCREREPSVLLLPCRHLCLCAACGPVVDACPVCSCTKNGSVQVNTSRVREK